MKKLIVIIILGICLFIVSCDNPRYKPGEHHRLLDSIVLPSKDFNLKWYLETSGGVYADNYYKIYKIYNDGSGELIYSKEVDFLNLKFEKINDDTIYLIERNSIEQYYEIMDTLENGEILDSGGYEFLRYEYDTLLLDIY